MYLRIGFLGDLIAYPTVTDLWSAGDFSRYIEDTTGDEIAQFTQHLNNMAKQLQNLLLRRQEMAISEERNRLARDLHDSAKQQALAASFELGAALTLFDRDLEGTKKHLMEADALVDSVRTELTNLVDELRLHATESQEFTETLNEYALDWSERSGIEVNIHKERDEELPLEHREILFRIAQEALANIARHSAAKNGKSYPGLWGRKYNDDHRGQWQWFRYRTPHTLEWD